MSRFNRAVAVASLWSVFAASGAGLANNTCVVPPTIAPISDETKLRTVVVTDPAVLSSFSLGRTLSNIITSAGGQDSPAAQASLLQTMIDSFGDTSSTNPISRITTPLTPRPGELNLKVADLLGTGPDGMRPVGLFNRLDLAPADWKYCGEYRIVYEKGAPVSRTNRLTVIFEAALDNPHPELLGEGCRPVAEFWNNLNSKTGQALSDGLQEFYYTGLTGGFRPVVHYLQYGLPFGQVRANLFVNVPPPQFLWQLREWHTRPNNGGVAFVPDTVKGNPLPFLYRAPPANEDPKVTVLRKAFWRDFVEKYVDEATQPELQAIATGTSITADDLLFHMGMPVDDKYDAFESQGSGDRDDPNLSPDIAELIPLISAKLDSLGLSAQCNLTPVEVLARAGAQSCGGCHQFSVGQTVADTGAAPFQWPGSLAAGGFVHIDEQGNLSPLLTDFFLPWRRKNLEDFIASAPLLTTAVDIGQVTEFRSRLEAPALEALNAPQASVQNQIIGDERAALRELDRQTPGAFIRFRPAD